MFRCFVPFEVKIILSGSNTSVGATTSDDEVDTKLETVVRGSSKPKIVENYLRRFHYTF